MATEHAPSHKDRVPLNRVRVLRAAVEVADRDGIGALTMRNLAAALEVEAMSLYYHVANKEAVLDGVIDVIAEEIIEAVTAIDAPPPADDWKTAMRMTILAARQVLLRHPWASRVMESRTNMSPTILTYFDGILGVFRLGGFSYDLAHHAMHALGSRALGFTQELFEPEDTDAADEEVGEMMEQMADQLPYMVAMMAEISHDDPDSTLGWCDDQTEFEFGLDIILDGLDRLRQAS